MKNTARRRASRQAPPQQLAFAAFVEARATLHGAVMSAGMSVLGAMLEEERSRVCGPRYQHDPDREAHRAGFAPSELALGGRRVSVRRPRARSKEGAEIALPLWEQFAASDPLTPRAVEQMVLGVATRKYARSLEPAPPGTRTRGTSRSAVSRRFVRATATELDKMLGQDLSGLDLVALIIDALHIGEHCVLIAVGVDVAGGKHVLGLHEGATENSTACTALLSGLEARGLRTSRSVLVVIDGSKALYKAVRSVFGARALVQRCQVHKRRNVLDHLPDGMRLHAGRTISAAYRSTDAARAKRMLEGLAKQLERAHPSAAASLREGLDETLTVLRFGLPLALLRTLATTNPIEHINSRIRRTCGRVDRWRGGTMVLRWVAVALREATKGFRRLRGHAGMPKLVAALRAHDRKLEGAIDGVSKAA